MLNLCQFLIYNLITFEIYEEKERIPVGQWITDENYELETRMEIITKFT